MLAAAVIELNEERILSAFLDAGHNRGSFRWKFRQILEVDG
jgi:hypothetical protein